MIKITILNDNIAGSCNGEHGFSCLIKAERKILFDLGPSDIFLKNANILNESLDDVDFIILSHGHWDHGNGLKYINNKPLICHPACFDNKYRKRDSSFNGLPLSREEAEEQFKVIFSKTPFAITENIIFLGEIPRLNDFESKKTDFYTDNKKDDYLLDDSALAIKSNRGLIIVTGCSHAGICNIIDYSKKICGQENIYAVLGGFHLRQYL